MNGLSVVVAVVGVAASTTFGILTALRAQYDRVLDVLSYISSEEVANARHALGQVIHGSGNIEQLDPEKKVALTHELFVVLWAFGRLDAVRRSLPGHRIRGFGLSGPENLLRDTSEDWVDYWAKHVDWVSDGLGADIGGVDDTSDRKDPAGGSARGLRLLAGAWSEPATTGPSPVDGSPDLAH